MSDAAGARPSRRRWLIVALTVSLAVNLFLIGGIAGTLTLIRAEIGPPGPLERVARRLNLDPAQEAAFRHLQTTMLQSGRAMRQANGKIWSALAAPATGTAKIGALLDQGVANKTAFEKNMAAAFGQFLMALTPAQRTEFITRLEALHRRGPFHVFSRLFR